MKILLSLVQDTVVSARVLSRAGRAAPPAPKGLRCCAWGRGLLCAAALSAPRCPALQDERDPLSAVCGVVVVPPRNPAPCPGPSPPPLPPGWDRFPWRSCPSLCFPCRPTSALEAKCKAGEKKAETLQKEKRRLEAELEAVSQKTHDASGQLVLISQELLRKER